ncbi:MAG: hypothetical protein F4015_10695, partial [Acidimicrobiia bacterium]|nr:hypothetical protein [Acidimicrobiia bacterium]
MSALSSLRRLWTGRATRRLMAWAVVWVVMAALLRVTLAAPEVCPAYSPGDGQSAIDAGADWIVRTQEPSGRY